MVPRAPRAAVDVQTPQASAAPASPERQPCMTVVRLEAWCAKHGFPHMQIGYGDAVVDVTRFIRDAWKTPALSGEAVRQAAA